MIEFGSELGFRPFAVYVREVDRVRARDVLVKKRLPGPMAVPKSPGS